MPDYKSLTHTRWDCKYHVVFIPKRRQKRIYGALGERLGEIFHDLAKRRGFEILEGHLMQDHIHMCISIPPKYSVSNAVGYLKGKSAIAIARQFREKQRNFQGEHFWARGYFVSTVGLDELMVREYIRHQDEVDAYRITPTNQAPDITLMALHKYALSSMWQPFCYLMWQVMQTPLSLLLTRKKVLLNTVPLPLDGTPCGSWQEAHSTSNPSPV